MSSTTTTDQETNRHWAEDQRPSTSELALLYQDETSDGPMSNFNKLVAR